jgi:Arc/MetJ family transcription regulator
MDIVNDDRLICEATRQLELLRRKGSVEKLTRRQTRSPLR